MKVTLVTLMNQEKTESTPHVHPSRHIIPAAPKGDIAIYAIEDGLDHVYAGDGRHIPRIVPGEEIAENLIHMICDSQQIGDSEARPGMFWVEGHPTLLDVKIKFKKEIAEANERQRRWYLAIVASADDMWQRFRQHKMISSLHRHACSELGLKRDWSMDTVERLDCPACGSQLPNPNVTICATCRTVIKPEEHKKFALATK